jgi:hypothetical protein
MASKQINPFFALFIMTLIGGTGTLFVVHKIATTPLVYDVVPPHSPAAHYNALLGNAIAHQHK